jgi:hypothetical protein
MYRFLLHHLGERAAVWGTAVWYAVLMIAVVLSFSVPAGEFRYGNM